MIKRVAKDCGAILLSPDELKELKDADLEKAADLFKRIVGAVK